MGETTARVLVADDDESVRALLAALLRDEFGVAVEAVQDGRAAVAALAGGAYALLVLDMRMPVVDGFGVLRWIAARPPAARVPVLALGGGMEWDREEALCLGAAACLAKPFDLEDVVAAVRPFLAAPANQPAA